MDNEKLKANDDSDAAAKVKEASAHSKDAIPRRRANIKMVQNVLLIWLDSNIDDKSNDCQNTVTQLRRVISDINTFTDSEECIQFVENINDNKVCMIISGSLGQHIVPRIHSMSQVDSIFIFFDDKKYHEQWVKDWSKVKGVFTEITSICEALKQAAQQCEQNATSISIMATSGDVSKKNLDQLEPTFMYTQILKEILLGIKFEQQHIIEFIRYCRVVLADNENELENVKILERKYHEETPIWWYTYECFLYPMLNRALRLMDADLMIKLGFFISDLYRHIEQLHNEQFGDHSSCKSFTVYRGQGMGKKDFEKMTKTMGGLLSFNCFLSTSENRNVSLSFAHQASANPDLVGILFIMAIDPTKSTAPFVSINNVGYYGDKEAEVLFAMHTVFRINEIKPMDENHRLFQVELTLTTENDLDLRRLTDCIREETHPEAKGWYRLGLVLLKMGRSDEAQEVYDILLNQTTNESEKADIYHEIGWAKDNQGKYQEAITFYEKSLEIDKKTLSPIDLRLAHCYNNIGVAYDNMGEYSNALSSQEKALEIKQQSLPSNDLDLAASYNNIGIVYKNMGEYSKALSSYEKALEIKQQSLPPNHPSLGSSYNNIGLVYENTGDYSKALSSYEKGLEIKHQSLPLNHPDLATSYNNIGGIYNEMGEYSKALSSHEKALAIRQESLPSNHPSLAASHNNMGNVYINMGDYLKAHSLYERAVNIGQQSLPSNHPHLQIYRESLEDVIKKL